MNYCVRQCWMYSFWQYEMNNTLKCQLMRFGWWPHMSNGLLLFIGSLEVGISICWMILECVWIAKNRLCSLELERSKGKTAERSEVFFLAEWRGASRSEWSEGGGRRKHEFTSATDAYCRSRGGALFVNGYGGRQLLSAWGRWQGKGLMIWQQHIYTWRT